MESVKTLIRNFAHEETGATMTEYGIMVALIAAIAIAAVQLLGTKVNAAFTAVNNVMP